jgi:hypothetical protein
MILTKYFINIKKKVFAKGTLSTRQSICKRYFVNKTKIGQHAGDGRTPSKHETGNTDDVDHGGQGRRHPHSE